MLEDGWIFDSSFPAATEDHLFGKNLLREIYQKADPSITTSVTVPILWDKKLKLLLTTNLHKSFEFLIQHSTT